MIRTVLMMTPLYSLIRPILGDLGSRWVPPNSINEEDDYHYFVPKKDSYLLVTAAGRHYPIRSDVLMCLEHKFSHCNTLVIRVTYWEIFCQNLPGNQSERIFLKNMPALSITSKSFDLLSPCFRAPCVKVTAFRMTPAVEGTPVWV